MRFFNSLNLLIVLLFFFFNETATTEIYTLSLHDALPISPPPPRRAPGARASRDAATAGSPPRPDRRRRCRRRRDRKSTRLNSSHPSISYAVFCLKKKTNIIVQIFILNSIKKKK